MGIEMRETGEDCSWVYFFFGWWTLPFSQEWWAISDTRYLVPQPFAARGYRALSRLLSHNQWPVVLEE
jgi:hypothetical protein